MSKRAIVMLLIGINAVLATTLIVAGWELPRANAQAAPLASNYLMVAGEINDDHDALVVIDLSARMMHTFDMDRGSKQLLHIDFRDLKQDFRGSR